MPLASQLGTKDETVVGTAVTVDEFWEYDDETIELETGRTESTGMRSGRRTAGPRFQPYQIGAAGNVKLDVLGAGFGPWLKRMLGAVATEDGADDDTYVHTASIANLCGTSFTMQANRPRGACASTNQPFTWAGGKVSKWGLSLETKGNLAFNADCVFMSETTETALAAASYQPAEVEVISWLGGSLKVDNVDVPVTKWACGGDNKLDLERLRLGAGGRKEPQSNGLVDVTASFECDWDTLALYNKFRAATAAGALCELTLFASAPSLIGDTLRPSIEIVLPAFRVDAAGPSGSGPAALMQPVSGVGRGPAEGSNDAITIAYTTTDATP